MKKLLFTLLLSPLFASAQINLEHEYVNQNPMTTVVNFTYQGKKYMSMDTSSQLIKFYNLDHSLWKNFNAPYYTGYKVNALYAPSDVLFNFSGLVDVIVVYYNSSISKYKSLLINENGDILHDLDSAYYHAVVNNGNDEYKLLSYYLRFNQPTVGVNCKVYSLPGSIPCDENCSSLKASNTQKQQPYLSDPIPNPSTGSTVVNFMLQDEAGVINVYNISGQMVQSLPVSRQQSSVQIGSGLIPGNYYYNLQSASGVSESKMLTVTR